MDRAKVDGEGRARYVQETRELTQGKVTKKGKEISKLDESWNV